MIYARADLDVVRTYTAWGSEMAHATVVGGRWNGHVYRLRSAKGLSGATRPGERNYHLDKVPALGEDSGGFNPYDWRGVFESDDLDTCLDLLVVELNRWVQEEDTQWQLADALRTLVNAVEARESAAPWRYAEGVARHWPEIREAFLHAEMVLADHSGGRSLPAMPTPPSVPWVAPVLWLDRPTRDGRTIRSEGSYWLENGSGVTLFVPGAGNSHTAVGSINSLVRVGDLVWGYGVATAEAAPRICSGELFVSVQLKPQGDIAVANGQMEMWDAIIQGAALLDRAENPWTSDGSWTQPLEDRS